MKLQTSNLNKEPDIPRYTTHVQICPDMRDISSYGQGRGERVEDHGRCERVEDHGMSAERTTDAMSA